MAKRPKKPGPIAVEAIQADELPPEEEIPPADDGEEEDLEAEQPPADAPEPPLRDLPDRKRGRGHRLAGETDLGRRVSEIQNWDDWVLYLYRLSPITDQTVAGKAVHITKYAEPIDENRIMHDFGSGGYRILANRRTETGAWSTAWRAEFDILNMDFPPKVPKGAWMADERNKRWAWAIDKETPAPPATPASDPIQMLQSFETIMDRRDARLRESLKESAPKESMLDAVKIGLEMARSATPAASGVNDPVFLIMKSQMDAQQRQIEEMNKRYLDLLEKQAQPAAAAPAPKSATEQIEETARIVEAARKISPQRGQVVEGHPITERVIDVLEKVLVPVAEAGAPMLFEAMARNQRQNAQQPRPAQQPPPAQPHPAPAAQPTQTPAVAAAPAKEAGNVNPPIPEVLQRNFPTALSFFMNRRSGTDFGDWLMASPEHEKVIPLMRQIGADLEPPMEPVEAILAICQGIPMIWSQIGPVPGEEARLRDFLTELITWTPAPDEPGEEPQQ